MNPPPRDPDQLRARTIGAFCDDLLDIGAGRSSGFTRTDTIHAIVSDRVRQENPADGTRQ